LEFFSKHVFDSLVPGLGYPQRVLCLGSCFAANIGTLLERYFFRVQCNPNGIIFNPMSLLAGMEIALNPAAFEEEKYVFEYQSRYYSWLHHGSFQSHSKNELLQRIQAQQQVFQEAIRQADVLLLTWGSAQVFTLASTGQIVANCHKLPGHFFQQRLLSVDEIVAAYTAFLHQLLHINPKLQIVWSISPVKYVRGGLHANNLSKSTLFLALQALREAFPNHYYFPAYEILQDELRDYRFYAADLAHPSEQAIQYIWDQFRQHVLSAEAQDLYKQLQPIRTAMTHRFLHPNTPAHAQFLAKHKQMVQDIQVAHPYLDLSAALTHFS